MAPVTSMRAFHPLMCLSFRGRCGMRRLIPSDRLAMPAPQFAIAAGPASFRSTRNGELARCDPDPAPRIQHARGIQSPPADLLTKRKPEYDGTFAKLGELRGWRTGRPPTKTEDHQLQRTSATRIIAFVENRVRCYGPLASLTPDRTSCVETGSHGRNMWPFTKHPLVHRAGCYRSA